MNPPTRNCAINGRKNRAGGECGRGDNGGWYRQADKRTMFVTIRMESLKCRTWARQHDDEVDSFASANPQPPQLHFLFCRRAFPRLPRPQAKPIVPRRTIPHHDTSYSLINPSIQLLAGHIQNASNTLLEPHVPVIVTVRVVSTSVPQHETPGSLLAHPHRLRTWSLLPLSLRRFGQASHLSPATPRLTTTSRFGTLDSWTWSWNPRLRC